jgi:hypothetical protein
MNGEGFVSVSTAFYPGASVDTLPVDCFLVSTDGVVFYVHLHRLLAATQNGFGGLLPGPAGQPIAVAEHSSVLNIVLLIIYAASFSQYRPLFDDLCGTVDALAKYGSLQSGALEPGEGLYKALLEHAPLRPLDVYALAGAHALEALAMASSRYLLSLSLPSLTEDISARIGTTYLRRLFFLHLGRVDALKRLLTAGPASHPSTAVCNFGAQQDITRAWALAAAYLSWNARADVSQSEISSAFTSLVHDLQCGDCRAALQERVKHLSLQWSLVKVVLFASLHTRLLADSPRVQTTI